MDPISNMLIMIKNANLAGKASVLFPYSKVKHAIVTCLKKEGYVGDISKKTRKNQPVLEVELVYKDSTPRISDVERISKGSRRIYFKVKDIQRVRGGTGLLVLSTPKGILSGKEAKVEQVGGEALFKIW